MKVIGHRGARHEAPENTIEGFDYANRLDIDFVEFDVRLSRDGQLVVIHDATVDRTTNGSGAVSDFTAMELAQLDARAAFPDWPVRCGVPTLSSVLEMIRPDLEMQIEIKRDTPEREEQIATALLAELDHHGVADRTIVTSFDPFALECCMRMAPGQALGLNGDWNSSEYLQTGLRLNCVHAGVSRTHSSADVVASARLGGISTVGWPCNTPEHFSDLLDWGVDGVCTDEPSLVLALRQEMALSLAS